MITILILLISCSAEQQTKRAQAALEKHDLAQAEYLFREAVTKDPQSINALIGLGWTYQLAGERSAAAKVFDRCLRVESKNPDCLRGRASVALSQGDVSKAKNIIETAYAAHPDHPGVLSSLALFRMNEGNIYKAKEMYISLNRRFPNKAEYLLGLGEAELRLRNPEEAASITGKALALSGTPIRYETMLWVLRARALITASAGREDPENCVQTAPKVDAWIVQAQEAVEKAQATGVQIPELPVLQRQVLRRIAIFEENCPPKRWKQSKD